MSCGQYFSVSIEKEICRLGLVRFDYRFGFLIEKMN